MDESTFGMETGADAFFRFNRRVWKFRTLYKRRKEDKQMSGLDIFIKIVEMIYKIVSAINTGGRFFFFLRKECKKYTIDENEDEAKTTSPVAAGEAEAHLHE